MVTTFSSWALFSPPVSFCGTFSSIVKLSAERYPLDLLPAGVCRKVL